MYKWSFTLHGPGGILSTMESGETQFVMGTEQAADVWTIAGEGVAARHALVRVAAARIQVEDLAGGTLVNGHPITGRVEAEYPASVQVGEVTLVVEQKSEDPSQAETIVQSPGQKGAPFDDLEILRDDRKWNERSATGRSGRDQGHGARGFIQCKPAGIL